MSQERERGAKLRKRAYQSPKLTEWGTINQLTLGVGQYGSPDSGLQPKSMASTF